MALEFDRLARRTFSGPVHESEWGDVHAGIKLNTTKTVNEFMNTFEIALFYEYASRIAGHDDPISVLTHAIAKSFSP
jgi:hypothetical protein